MQDQSRYERKFVTERWNRAAVEQNVKLNAGCFNEIFHLRQVNNIYFDTPLLKAFYDNTEGNTHRKKYRIRWYGEKLGNIKSPVLEVKIKNAFLGSKLSFKLKPFTFSANISTVFFASLFADSDLPKEIKFEISEQVPVLYNSYCRRYFRSFDQKFRITVDDQMEFTGIYPENNSLINSKKLSGKTILELKYDEKHDNTAHRISGQFPYRYSKSSKYTDGISLTRNLYS